MVVGGLHQSLTTRLASYSPPAIRTWVQSHEPQPSKSTIDAERHKRRVDIHKDNQSFPSSTTFLHPHFCLNSVDRSLAYHEGVSDIRDAVCTLSSYIYVHSLTPTHL